MTAKGTMMEYISPVYQPDAVAMSAPPAMAMMPSGMASSISAMTSSRARHMGPIIKFMAPMARPAMSASSMRSTTALVKVLVRARRW